MIKRLIVCLVALALALPGANAAVTLFDFETELEVATWVVRNPKVDSLSRAPLFATAGQSAMRFTTPRWTAGMAEWPAIEVKPPVADWRGFDRLVIDITNPDPERHFFSLFVSDSQVPFREALSFRLELPARGFQRFTVPLSGFPENVNREDIAILHFFTQRPAMDMTLYLDNLTLLGPGETLPEPGPAFVRQVAALALDNLDDLDRAIDERAAALAAVAKTPEQQRNIKRYTDGLRESVSAARRVAAAPGLTLAQLAALRGDLAKLPGRLDRLASVVRFESDFDRLGLGSGEMVAGFASSMEKIPPRDMPFRLRVARGARVSLARNEKESLQVAVTPRTADLEGVQVRVSDLTAANGAIFSAANVSCEVMGYVKTESNPPYLVPYVGWWPDPILDFLGPVDIATDDLQTFWVRFRAPKDQPAGIYRGQLTVSAANASPLTFDLSVRVHDFTLPDCTPLPTAITFFEHPEQMGGVDNWPRMKLRYADFLADYYIDYDSLYRGGPPDFEIIKHLHDRGRLVAFNLGNVFNGGTSEEGFDQAVAEVVERIRPGYEQAKAMGLLDHAYIYGFDERGQDQFPLLERSVQALRQAFPEVVLMTTSYDASYGLESVVKTIDAWCPLTPSFVPERAAQARAQGKYVWWYICCGPQHPYANWFVEYPAIEARLLMGAMTARQRPDGFLYYSLTIWNENKPIESGPFTEWNPVSWTTYHGDGSLFCSGPGGKPVPTIRLENYRDGLEDFAYAVILEDIIRQYKQRPALTVAEREWITEAEAALVVPEGLVRTMSQFTDSSTELYRWRTQMAELIDRSGVSDADPWGVNFGVRGFR